MAEVKIIDARGFSSSRPYLRVTLQGTLYDFSVQQVSFTKRLNAIPTCTLTLFTGKKGDKTCSAVKLACLFMFSVCNKQRLECSLYIRGTNVMAGYIISMQPNVTAASFGSSAPVTCVCAASSIELQESPLADFILADREGFSVYLGKSQDKSKSLNKVVSGNPADVANAFASKGINIQSDIASIIKSMLEWKDETLKNNNYAVKRSTCLGDYIKSDYRLSSLYVNNTAGLANSKNTALSFYKQLWMLLMLRMKTGTQLLALVSCLRNGRSLLLCPSPISDYYSALLYIKPSYIGAYDKNKLYHFTDILSITLSCDASLVPKVPDTVVGVFPKVYDASSTALFISLYPLLSEKGEYKRTAVTIPLWLRSYTINTATGSGNTTTASAQAAKTDAKQAAIKSYLRSIYCTLAYSACSATVVLSPTEYLDDGLWLDLYLGLPVIIQLYNDTKSSDSNSLIIDIKTQMSSLNLLVGVVSSWTYSLTVGNVDTTSSRSIMLTLLKVVPTASPSALYQNLYFSTDDNYPFMYLKVSGK